MCVCVCVCRGGGGESSDFFQSKLQLSEILGGSNICYPGRGGGEGASNFFPRVGVQLLSDITYDSYWTPVSALDPRNYHES